MTFPRTCLRGLRKSDWSKDGRILGVAFAPDHSTSNGREDRCSETSVNFEDDDGAVTLIKRDTVMAAHGVARLPLVAVDEFRARVQSKIQSLRYERARVHGNDYHGNILFPAGIAKFEAAALASVLAISAEIVAD